MSRWWSASSEDGPAPCDRQVLGWYKALQPWQRLERAYRDTFLPPAAKKFTDPDAQAAAFLHFIEGEAKFPRVRVWGLARNFAEVFPKSAGRREAETLLARLEAGFRKEKMQVVVHGHIPVLEPVPAPPRVPPGTGRRRGPASTGSAPCGASAPTAPSATPPRSRPSSGVPARRSRPAAPPLRA